MRAIWGTDTRCRLDAEKQATRDMLADVEAKVGRLHDALEHRPAHNFDEAMQQITAGRH